MDLHKNNLVCANWLVDWDLYNMTTDKFLALDLELNQPSGLSEEFCGECYCPIF